jgi:hypothetical protein
MKLWLLLVVGAIIVISSGVAVRSHIKSEARKTDARKKREAVYESTLQAYSQDLNPGLTRKEVEEYLRAKGTGFKQMCCVLERSAFADLVKVGREDAPWFCSENYVYIAFEFAATEPHDSLISYASDELKKVRVFRQLGGCL